MKKITILLFLISMLYGCGGTVRYGVSTSQPESLVADTKVAINRVHSSQCVVKIKNKNAINERKTGSKTVELEVMRCDKTETYEVRYILLNDNKYQIYAKQI